MKTTVMSAQELRDAYVRDVLSHGERAPTVEIKKRTKKKKRIGVNAPINVNVQNIQNAQPAGPRLVRTGDRSRIVAAFLALFLGGIGVHKVYLGRIAAGVIYFLFCLTCIPLFISLIECIQLFCMSDNEFDMRYNCEYVF